MARRDDQTELSRQSKLRIQSEIIDWTRDGCFQVIQCEDHGPIHTVFCKFCGGRSFNVGQCDFTTAIRCINCGWEATIHES